jgi:hypothetical protein
MASYTFSRQPVFSLNLAVNPARFLRFLKKYCAEFGTVLWVADARSESQPDPIHSAQGWSEAITLGCRPNQSSTATRLHRRAAAI